MAEVDAPPIDAGYGRPLLDDVVHPVVERSAIPVDQSDVDRIARELRIRFETGHRSHLCKDCITGGGVLGQMMARPAGEVVGTGPFA